MILPKNDYASEEGKKKQEKALPLPVLLTLAERLLAVMLIRNGQLLAPFGTAGSQHTTAVL